MFIIQKYLFNFFINSEVIFFINYQIVSETKFIKLNKEITIMIITLGLIVSQTNTCK